MTKDLLGKRMKEQYEQRTRILLPRRTYTIIRLDGKAFHTYTRGLKRPYDEGFMRVMDETAMFLCQEIQGAQMAYVQSDEISILLTDFERDTTDAWFNGNIQKMVSVSASLATGKFNEWMTTNWGGSVKPKGLAFFDARVFTIPDPIEVENYFIWRQKDAVRNSISMLAQSLYSHKELNGKSQSNMHDMIIAKGKNWNDVPDGFKRGRTIKKVHIFDIENAGLTDDVIDMGSKWSIKTPDFLKERYDLRDFLPRVNESKLDPARDFDFFCITCGTGFNSGEICPKCNERK